MKFFGEVLTGVIVTGESYSLYLKCFPPQKPAPNSIFSLSFIINVYPADTPAPTDCPSLSSGRKRPVLLKEEYCILAPTHQPENTYQGQ